ncbi:MAG: 16S rRNA (cytosine(1402)-N(4))-methyltransferase RsmH [Candidatus Omnitrophica bacterium]|nr:16S rRNA (cytosine(1402)-N(4))-methyltransferase RsmH [Candidatus Omnitrophota bacterium]
MGAEVLDYLNPKPGQIIVDGTAGTGGHSLLALPRILPQGRLIAIDRDRESLDLAKRRLTEFEPQATFLPGNYRHLPDLLAPLGFTRVDGIVLDLGMSSVQLDLAERGFSFMQEGPLDMRMDRGESLTAEMLVNRLPADELATLFERFGEERFAKRIARHLAEARRRQPITTTTQLARVIALAVPAHARHGRLHPATRVFQALRLAVNDELGALEAFLGQVQHLLRPGGRVVILSFHSLEDRLVKHAFAQGARAGWWTALTKKPLRPSATEVSRNPRARSAKLRALERC